MAKVKCKCCGASIDKKVAIGIPHNKVTWYYCANHVGQKSPREKVYDIIFEIFGRQILNTVIYKELDPIIKEYGAEKMIAYLEENKTYLEQCMSKNFSSEYASIRYISAIIRNNIHDFTPHKSEPIRKSVEIDFDVAPTKYKQKQQRTGMDALLDDILGS